jgi:hypothetical protein
MPAQISAPVRRGKALPGLNAGRLDYWGRGRPAPTEPNKNQIRLRKIARRCPSGLRRPLRHMSQNDCAARSPAGAGLLAHRLLRRYDLVDRNAFGLNVVALFYWPRSGAGR